MTTCHKCGAEGFLGRDECISYNGVQFGVFEVMVCGSCGARIVSPEVSREIDRAFAVHEGQSKPMLRAPVTIDFGTACPAFPPLQRYGTSLGEAIAAEGQLL